MASPAADAAAQRMAPYTMARQTCTELLAKSSAEWTDLPCRVDVDAAVRFARELDIPKVKAFGASLASDANFTGTTCQFATVDAEAGFILLLHALDFGSGWRQELHRHHGKGAYLTIKPGVEALYAKALDEAGGFSAEWLRSCTKADVARTFALEDNAEVEDLLDLLLQVIHELGRGCTREGSLEAFVARALEASAGAPQPAAELVWALVDSFPETFDDRYTLRAVQPVCFFKKSQLVVGELYHRFREEDSRFRFADGDDLTAYVDNVICATLRYKGVVVPNADMTKMIEAGEALQKGSEQEVCFRAAALCGVEAVTAATGHALTSSELGNYLWAGLGKEPAIRKYQRHATKTVFY
ncbi:unnamed protein product [Symbiodinium natans]|uniref:Queuosine 5'-phosphate N-glycosylase/hydrolase n=1 Tax=Symbiodinium natans TaxID=878477 RepID=A0A812IZ84_9DINO|nr:unnamed protein product [Symbiodinium natans]